MATGRFAPSPTGELHIGNLRTAMVAWLAARSTSSAFLLRMEDLDRVTSARDHEVGQQRDLTAIGLDWDGAVVRQSERFDRYEAAIARLDDAGQTYPCFCSRREIREAPRAPHSPPDVYPGTCRDLGAADRAAKEASGRPPALRLRTEGEVVSFTDAIAGQHEGRVDDVVLRRNDGVPAYQLAVVVDDAAQGVEQVVRGDDLLGSTPSQIHLARLLGLAEPSYAHVPLVVGEDGSRLAKRHGAVTLTDLRAQGIDAAQLRSLLAVSLGWAERGEPVEMDQLLVRFALATIPRTA
ncbi:MAG TPA: tRNA glutamyl-Q(34) synthetase GluQRS, partial [Microthrixaceae bacterium]|nr:tRNA glutamyl-Q(34) synthetase GluQRS [Microthrixaceae bacterium]